MLKASFILANGPPMNRTVPIIENEFYHVYNRGNDGLTVFRCPWDYQVFLSKLFAYAGKYLIRLVVYTLMPNHYHLVLTEPTGGNLPRMMDALGTSTAKRFNLKYGHKGHVFESRYRYEHIPSNESIAEVCRYVHLNPVRARLVALPEEWDHSDFRDFLSEGRLQESKGVLHRAPLLNLFGSDPKGYVKFVREGVLYLH